MYKGLLKDFGGVEGFTRFWGGLGGLGVSVFPNTALVFGDLIF